MPILAKPVFLEVLSDPVPAVGVTITGLDPAGPSTVTLWRSTPGQVRTVVPGVVDKVIFGAEYVVDYAVPLGVPVTYTVEVTSGAVVPDDLSATILVESDVCWVQDPVNPFNSLPMSATGKRGFALIEADSLAALSRSVSGTVTQVMGSSFPVAMGGTRQAPEGAAMRISTWTAEQTNQLRAVLDESYPLLFRGTLPFHGLLPPSAYLHVDVSEEPRGPSLHGEGEHYTAFALTATVVRPPTSGVVVARLTYQAVADYYAGSTYADMVDGRSYLEWQKAPLERAGS